VLVSTQVWKPPPATARAAGLADGTELDAAAAAEGIGRHAAIATTDASRSRATPAVKRCLQRMCACGDLMYGPSLVA
jgi:hypothetical protein